MEIQMEILSLMLELISTLEHSDSKNNGTGHSHKLFDDIDIERLQTIKDRIDGLGNKIASNQG